MSSRANLRKLLCPFLRADESRLDIARPNKFAAQPVTQLKQLRVEQHAQPATLYARETSPPPQAGQPSRQRVTYVGFDQCDIRRTDRAIRIHVFAEIRARDRRAHLRFGQGDIGGIDRTIGVHVSDQHAHENGNVPGVCAIANAIKHNGNSLNVGHASKIDGNRRRSTPADAAHAPGATSHCRTATVTLVENVTTI